MNYMAVVASAIASMVIGSLWYGPLFRKTFMQAMGMDKWTPEKQAAEKKKMGTLYATQLVASLVMFYVLALLLDMTGSMGLNGGLYVAFLTWIGFVVPVQLGNAIWGGNMTLFYLGAGNMLATLLAAGAIMGLWS